MTLKERLEKKKSMFSLKEYLTQRAVKRALKLQHRAAKREAKAELATASKVDESLSLSTTDELMVEEELEQDNA